MANSANAQPELVQVPCSSAIFVNPRCVIHEEEDMRVVTYVGMPVFYYHRDDRSAEATFIAQAQEAGFAKGTELAAALGKSVRTVYRMRHRFLYQGVASLTPKKPGPKGPRLGARREAAIRRWHLEGHSMYWMAQTLRISPQTVKRALKRMGLFPRSEAAGQAELLASVEEPRVTAGDDPGPADGDGPIEQSAGGLGQERAVAEAGAAVNRGSDTGLKADASATEVCAKAEDATGLQSGTTLDVDPSNRSIDRMLAAAGQLDDAAPLFVAAKDVPRAGVLLAVPALVNSGVFEAADEVYGNIGPAFYGLRTILLTMVLLVLLRIRHPENVKEHSPGDLGRILGLDRAPEVKTIWRKLARLTTDAEQSERFIAALVRRRAARAQEALGYLYVDGHVRVYHGKAKLPKTHVARMRLSLPATQDVWVNDAIGAPVFFVTQQAHPQLVSALPPVLAEVRRLVGKRRVTVVFDRGGWSPKLFKRMHRDGFDVLTYRKGKADAIPVDQFTAYEVELPAGKVTYELHDTSIVVGDGFEMRQVTRRKGDHQTHIVTTRTDLAVTDVAWRMFNRWRQENFFKYMRQEFASDALIEYGSEPDDPDRLVPNPARKVVDRDIAAAKEELVRLEAEYGKAWAAGQERIMARPPGFTLMCGMHLVESLEDARRLVKALETKREQVPTTVPIGEIKDEVVRLPSARKRFSDALKMLAYQVETDLTRGVAPHFARSLHEGRTLISAALQSSADIEPVAGELHVTLAAQSSRNRSIALARLCRELNDTETLFPGTSLRLRYAVQGVEHDT
jgi:transposase